MRTNPFVAQGRHALAGGCRATFYHRVQAKAGERLTVAVEKDRLGLGALAHKLLEGGYRFGPQWATTIFAPFSMQGGQPLINGGRMTVPLIRQVAKKGLEEARSQIFQPQLIHRAMTVLGGKGEQQQKGVPVAVLSVGRQITLCHHMFQQEPSHPRSN
jgi:hypothetical protein